MQRSLRKRSDWDFLRRGKKKRVKRGTSGEPQWLFTLGKRRERGMLLKRGAVASLKGGGHRSKGELLKIFKNEKPVLLKRGSLARKFGEKKIRRLILRRERSRGIQLPGEVFF